MIEPGKVYGATTDLDGVPAGYQGMADRKSLKALIKPCRLRAQGVWPSPRALGSAMDSRDGSGVERF
ncbi:hypothetical protein [Streptomyces sp. NPDC087437]|uniref:hypothetical protein n=1 Tax=Streptomyces sp. NPDC087437 TaxID=3365789 RepID=UPI00380C1345